MKLDKEEKEILDAYESGKMKPVRPSKNEIDAIKAAAESTFKKDKRVTIRLYDHDFKGIQKICIVCSTTLGGYFIFRKKHCL